LRQVSIEPIEREIGDSVQRARLLEEVGSARDDLDWVRLFSRGGKRTNGVLVPREPDGEGLKIT
jgi:hypothetical protein